MQGIVKHIDPPPFGMWNLCNRTRVMVEPSVFFFIITKYSGSQFTGTSTNFRRPIPLSSVHVLHVVELTKLENMDTVVEQGYTRGPCR